MSHKSQFLGSSHHQQQHHLHCMYLFSAAACSQYNAKVVMATGSETRGELSLK